LRSIALFFLLISFVHAGDWALKKDYVLKKDEVVNAIIKTDTSTKILSFRWTLFKNEGLVFLTSFDDNVMQNILYKHYRNRAIKIVMNDVYIKYKQKPYLLLEFKGYDFVKHEAKIQLLLHDPNSRVSIKFIKK